MQRKLTIAALAPVLAATIYLAAAPAAGAHAGGPLLSGYGPPGAGAQTIIGATLVNGPPGGAGGGGAAGAGGPSATVASAGSGAEAASTAHAHGGVASEAARTGFSRSQHTGSPGGRSAESAHRLRGGSEPGSTGLGTFAQTEDSGGSWFTGADLAAVALAAGALAIVALATVRLARSEHG